MEEQIQKIILRSNLAISQATRQIPSALLAKEKESLTPLPTKVIRDSYRIDHPKAKVSASNLISFRGSPLFKIFFYYYFLYLNSI